MIEEKNKEGVSICISKLSLLVPAKANITQAKIFF